ncbi:MAG: hypothetical protein AMXMBFR48_21240 [Ignavibacteriales bacterium]
MIINFSIQNFGSFKERQTLNFEADKSTHLEESYIIKTGRFRILKMALIFGANASGKTTILKSQDFLRELVLKPASSKTEVLNFQPFLFDKKNNQNSVISIEFVSNQIKYAYQVEFFSKAVVSEVLYNYNPGKSLVFKRSTDLVNQLSEIRFGEKIRTDRTASKILEGNTLWNNTVLGGFLKTNIDMVELKDVTDWFKNYLYPIIHPRFSLEGFIASKFDKGDLQKHDVIDILKKADLNISDIIMNEEEIELPDRIIETLKSQLKDSPAEIRKIEENKIIKLNIAFEHTVNQVKYSLPIEQESQGTRRYFGFAGLLALLVKKPAAFPVDELESSLHPDLFLHFIITFLLNAKHSQIIATTHNREILDNKDIFRNDAIWFTDKNKNSSTELYSLADFDSSVVRNTTNVLNAYKSGKLRANPILGDNYIN